MMLDIWDQFLAIAVQEVGSRVVETWFKALSFCGCDTGGVTVYLEAPNPFVKDWVCNHYLSLLQIHLGRLLHVDRPKIVVSVKGIYHASSVQIVPKHLAVNQIIEASEVEKPFGAASLIKPAKKNFGHINSNYIFDTFVVGPNNSLAYAAAHAIAQKPGAVYNPLFLYGDSGLGKTHLLHAIGNEIRKHHCKATILYQTADRFVSEFINSIRFDKVHKFQQKYQSIDVLLVDDIQFISNKEQTQEAFFHIFNALYDAHKQIVFSSDTFPQNIAGITERLQSRLGCGLVADIYVPSLETKVAILSKKAVANNITLPDEVACFIASRVVSNVRELEGALIRTMAFALLSKQPITIDLVKQVLTHDQVTHSVKKRIDLHAIVQSVSKHYSYDFKELCSDKRHKELTDARHVAMFLMKKLTNKSLRDIGSYLGNRDHATVKHAVKKIEELLETNQNLQKNIRQIEHDIIS